MKPRIIAGLGYRQRCPAEDIIAAFERACIAARARADALACPVFKADEPGLHEATRRLGLSVMFVETHALQAAQASCVTKSDHAVRAIGVASVAEGCALAVAGPSAVLLVPRVSAGAATCAIATASRNLVATVICCSILFLQQIHAYRPTGFPTICCSVPDTAREAAIAPSAFTGSAVPADPASVVAEANS